MTKRKYNTGKIRTFLLFLALATIIWILTKFSKEYTATLNGTIVYTDIPENVVLSDSNPKELSFEITANGFRFLQYQFNRPQLNVSLANGSNGSNERIILGSNDLYRIVSEELGSEVSVKNLSRSELIIEFDQLASKMVPVISEAKVQFREGFKSIDGVLLEPDSVRIAAPEGLMEEITSIHTEAVSLNDVHESETRNLSLLLPEQQGIQVRPTSVTLRIDVTEFTQKTISVPVEVLNLPEDVTVKIIPEMISLTFDVAMDRYNDITASDFTLVCDYSNRNSDNNSMLITLDEQPAGVINVELSEKKVDYLIFK